jgi:hypothetical protein
MFVMKIRPNIYVGYVNDRLVKLVYRGDDKADLYINGEFKGLCPFTYTKSKVEELEGVGKIIDVRV